MEFATTMTNCNWEQLQSPWMDGMKVGVGTGGLKKNLMEMAVVQQQLTPVNENFKTGGSYKNKKNQMNLFEFIFTCHGYRKKITEIDKNSSLSQKTDGSLM